MGVGPNGRTPGTAGFVPNAGRPVRVCCTCWLMSANVAVSAPGEPTEINPPGTTSVRLLSWESRFTPTLMIVGVGHPFG